MTDRDALYRAILDRPDDDTLRLVYADALEEGGDPRRAAAVRTHVELSRLPEYDPRWVRARHHERERLPSPLWAQELELPDGIRWAREPFRRGLPGAVQAADGSAFAEHADDLFARYPIESLELRVVRLADVRELTACPWLERITSLSLAQGVSEQAVTRLLASPHLTRLTELHVGPELTTPAAVSAVARSRVFRQLTSLGVRDDRRGGGTMAGALARLADPPRLRRLDLSSNRLRAELLRPLVESPAVESVEDLDLSDNNLGLLGAAALAEAPLPRLRTLHLLRTRPESEGVSFLAGAAFFPELRSLSLGGNNLGPAAVSWLVNPAAGNLRVLDLRENRLGDLGAISLAENPHLAGVLDLDLAETHIGDAGADALADSPHLGGLVYLNLYGNAISPRAESRLRARFGDRVFL